MSLETRAPGELSRWVGEPEKRTIRQVAVARVVWRSENNQFYSAMPNHEVALRCAASADLLEACRALTAITEMLGQPKLRAARDLAFRAIAKAEGRDVA